MCGDGVHSQIRRLVSHLKGEERERRIMMFLKDPSRIKRAQRSRLNRILLKRSREADRYLTAEQRLFRKLR